MNKSLFCLYFGEIIVLILGDNPKRFSKHCRVCHSLSVFLFSWSPSCLGSRGNHAFSKHFNVFTKIPCHDYFLEDSDSGRDELFCSPAAESISCLPCLHRLHVPKTYEPLCSLLHFHSSCSSEI